MAEVSLPIPATPRSVYEVIADPLTYPSWLVGCKAMRSVDPTWPQPGLRFHHRVGIGPLTVDDSSRVIALEHGRSLHLEVRAWPLGRGEVVFRVDPEPEDPDSTRVSLHEVPIGALAVARPLLEPLVEARNRRSLRNLRRYLTEPAEAVPPA